MPLYEASGIPGTGGQNSPAAIRYEFQRIGEAFAMMEVTPISVAQLAGVPIPAGQVVGQLTSAQIASIQAAQITGQITGAQIASGAVSGTQFASGIEPVTIVTAVPGSRLTSTIYNTTDGRLYRWQDTAYVNLNAAGSIIGQLTAGQIAAGAITTTQLAAGAVTADRLAANSVTAAAIAARSITANEIAANTLTANELAANSVTALQIAADAVRAANIQAGAVTTTAMTANSINGDRIQANTLNANRIVAGSITTDRMTAGSINGDRITAGTLSADRLVANSITAGQIQADLFSADNIVTRSITLRDSSGTVILSPTTLLQPAYAAPALRNSNITVDGGGALVGIGTGGVVVNNQFITINGSGQIQGIGSGAGTAIRNSLITLSGGSGTVALNNAGGGSVTGIVMPGNPIGPANRGTYLEAGTIVSDLIASRTIVADRIATDTLTVDEIQVGQLSAQAVAVSQNVVVPVTGGGDSGQALDIISTPSVSLLGVRPAAGGLNCFAKASGSVIFNLSGNFTQQIIVVSVTVTIRVRLTNGFMAAQDSIMSWQGYQFSPFDRIDIPFCVFCESSLAWGFTTPAARASIDVDITTPYAGLNFFAGLNASARVTLDVRRV